jgi:uncharacterized membrane protein
MLPDPLHPAVVHFPIVLMAFLPLAALGALWAVRRGVAPLRAWAVPVVMAGALTLSAWASLETGQDQEERAEDIVGEQRIEAHEEAAERFLIFSGVVFGLSAAGLVRGATGRGMRAVTTVATLGLLVAGYQVGHSGGTLVYGEGGAPGVSQLSAGGGEGGGAAERDARGERDEDD